MIARNDVCLSERRTGGEGSGVEPNGSGPWSGLEPLSAARNLTRESAARTEMTTHMISHLHDARLAGPGINALVPGMLVKTGDTCAFDSPSSEHSGDEPICKFPVQPAMPRASFRATRVVYRGVFRIAARGRVLSWPLLVTRDRSRISKSVGEDSDEGLQPALFLVARFVLRHRDAVRSRSRRLRACLADVCPERRRCAFSRSNLWKTGQEHALISKTCSRRLSPMPCIPILRRMLPSHARLERLGGPC